VHISFLPFSTSDEEEINGKVYRVSNYVHVSSGTDVTHYWTLSTACNFGSPQAGSCKFYLLGILL